MPRSIPNEMPHSIAQHSIVQCDTAQQSKSKRRYLTGAEIITLLQNTNKVFNANEIQGPLEEP